jgi:uncharacterized protein with PIN domain
MINRFVADVHLGKLARLLRMLGFDTIYSNASTKEELRSIALTQNRILLTRNASLHKIGEAFECCIIQHFNPFIQLKHVIAQFHLKEYFKPFSRCLLCNGELHAVPPGNISDLIQPDTALHFNDFWQCNDCRHVYWEGSHYERMQSLIKKMEEET